MITNIVLKKINFFSGVFVLSNIVVLSFCVLLFSSASFCAANSCNLGRAVCVTNVAYCNCACNKSCEFSENCELSECVAGSCVNSSESDELSGDVFEIAQDGDIEKLAKLISYKKIDINSVNKDGKTLLYIASCENYFDMVKFLVQNGATKTINKAMAGWTPLYNACYNNNLEMVKFLILNGAEKSVNKDNNFWKRTPIYWACRNNNLEMVKFLLVHGAGKSVNKETAFFGGTTLYWACYHGNLPMVKCLVAGGADINQVTSYGETLLYWACKYNDMAIFNYLFDIASKGLENSGANKLCEFNPSVSFLSKLGELKLGEFNARASVANKSCKFNLANINLASKDGNETPLYCACQNNNFEMVQTLVRNGAEISQKVLDASVQYSKIHKYLHGVLAGKHSN